MYIFLLGRPGCGKSAIYKIMVEKLKNRNVNQQFPRVDDFPKLWQIFKTDETTGEWKRCRKTPDGGYKVTDDTVWDDILKQLNTDLLKYNPDEIVFVEFSRSNYISALKNFSSEVINNSIIVYIDCSFETCWQRNVERHKKALAEGTDDHLVSREEMEKTYLYDDKEKLLSLETPKVFLLVNEQQGTEHLVKPIEEIVNYIVNWWQSKVTQQNI